MFPDAMPGHADFRRSDEINRWPSQLIPSGLAVVKNV